MLAKWLKSAFKALYVYKEKKEYVLQRNVNKSDKIEIVDADNTGRIMKGMRWSNGIHEMFEIKHGIMPATITLSHGVYYPLYRSIYGLTGRLGSQYEREEIKAIYGIDSFDVPTYRPNRRLDKPVRIVATNQAKSIAICESIFACQAQGRPSLSIFASIKESEDYDHLLKSKNVACEILNEMQKKKEEDVLAQAGRPDSITIATNTAARRTDIKPDEMSLQNGGLNVSIGFYPESSRVEMQARGRAGRQGQKGSSEIIVSLEDLGYSTEIPINDPTIQNLIIQQLEKKREMRGQINKDAHICQVELERYCHLFVEGFYQSLANFNRVVTRSDFLNDRATLLADRKLIKAKIPGEQLSPVDRKIATQALGLFVKKGCTVNEWVVILKEAGEVLQRKIIQQWSTSFYQQMKK